MSFVAGFIMGWAFGPLIEVAISAVVLVAIHAYWSARR